MREGFQGAGMTNELENAAAAGETALVADAAASEVTTRGAAAVGACANCGEPLQGRHCHACGQLADDLHRPIWSLIGEAFENLFAFDGRVARTVPALLFQPGRVTAAYLAGGRARFMTPFRLFVFASLVFLLAFSLVAGDWTDVSFGDDPEANEARISAAEEELARIAEEFEAEGDDASLVGIERARAGLAAARAAGEGEDPELAGVAQRREAKCSIRRELLPEEPSPDCALPESAAGGGAAASAVSGPEFDTSDALQSWPIGVRRLIVHQSEVIIDDPARFFEAVNRWLPRLLVALFPVYALLLAGSQFWKRDFFVYDHVIVSLHFHAFLFLMATLLLALSLIAPVWLLVVVGVAWSNLALYRIHRLVYRASTASAAVRTATLDAAYMLFLAIFAPLVLAGGGFLTA